MFRSRSINAFLALKINFFQWFSRINVIESADLNELYFLFKELSSLK